MFDVVAEIIAGLLPRKVRWTLYAVLLIAIAVGATVALTRS